MIHYQLALKLQGHLQRSAGHVEGRVCEALVSVSRTTNLNTHQRGVRNRHITVHQRIE